jgi:hypothetical protein
MSILSFTITRPAALDLKHADGERDATLPIRVHFAYIVQRTRTYLLTYLHTYLLTYRAEPFFRSCQLCKNSRTSQHFMEPEGSLPRSQEPSTGPIFSQIDPVHTISSYLSKIYFNIVHPPTSLSCFFLLASPSISYMHSSYPHSCYMPFLSHPPLLDHSNYTWRRI